MRRLSATVGNSPVADFAVQQQQQLPQGLGVAGHAVLFVALDEQVERLVQLFVGHLELRVRDLEVLVFLRHLRQLGLKVARMLFLALAEGALRRSVLRSPSLQRKLESEPKTLLFKRGECSRRLSRAVARIEMVAPLRATMAAG